MTRPSADAAAWRLAAGRRRRGRLVLVGAMAVVGLGLDHRAVATAENAPSGLSYCAVVAIDRVGAERLATLQTSAAIAWWVEADDQLLACAEVPGAVEAAAAAGGFGLIQNLPPLARERFAVLPGATATALERAGLAAVVSAGRRAVVIAPVGQTAELRWTGAHVVGEGAHGPTTLAEALEPLVGNTVLARQAANRAAPSPTAHRNDLSVTGAPPVDEVDIERWFDDLSTLAGWNRWTRGTQILLARDWLVSRFAALPGITVHTELFAVGANTGWNVIATLPGLDQPDERVVVGAHYDATSQSTATAAPGAEDNASGCAAVLELAHIMSRHPPAATIQFICYSGEEQGLYGSVDHAAKLVANGEAASVKAVLIMDMIGYTNDADLDCLLESNAANAALVNLFADAAAAFTSLRIVTSTNPFGSDHVPYLNRAMPALLVIENDWDDYPHYHRTTDLPAQISLALGEQMLRMNIAALQQLAGKGVGGVFTDGFESGDTQHWDP